MYITTGDMKRKSSTGAQQYYNVVKDFSWLLELEIEFSSYDQNQNLSNGLNSLASSLSVHFLIESTSYRLTWVYFSIQMLHRYKNILE